MRSPAAIPDGPAVSPLVVSLTLERASALLDAALRLERHHDILPLTVVVFDSGGHMIALKSEDGSGIFRLQVANAKAYGALGIGVSTRVIGQRLADRPVFVGSLSVVSDGQFVPVPGGVLIRAADGHVIGGHRYQRRYLRSGRIRCDQRRQIDRALSGATGAGSRGGRFAPVAATAQDSTRGEIQEAAGPDRSRGTLRR